jgi:hypothetical protein
VEGGARGRSPWVVGAGDNGRRQQPWWVGRGPAATEAALPQPIEPSEPPPPGNGWDAPSSGFGREPAAPVRVRSIWSGAPYFVVAAGVFAILFASSHWFPSPILSRALVPVLGFFATLGASRYLLARHPDEPWLGWIFVVAVLVKEFASYLRYSTLKNSYGQVGDASVYDTFGQRYYQFWTGRSRLVSILPDVKKSNFLRFFTGVVYYLLGNDMIAGFLVFGLIAFVGSYLWYRAAVEAVPFLDKRLYFLVVMFVPSILFWPSSIGKEALMQFATGSAALATAHLLNGKLLRGLLVGLPGVWLMWVVRPHLLALVLLALGPAYLIGRGPRARGDAPISTSLVRPIGLVVIGFLLAFAVTQGAKSLGLPSLTLGSVNAELEQTSLQTSQEGSAFNTGNTSITPLRLPQGMVTVLLRPFPWEAPGFLQKLASLEGIALVAFAFIRRRSIAASLRHIRIVPFLFYCWVLTILYSLTFQAFGNFGLLDRQRSLVLPALYVLLCLDWHKAREFDDERRARAELRRAEYARGVR